MVFTIKAKNFPTLFYINRELAEKEAKKHNLEICFIEYNGYDIGYGLYDCKSEKLIELNNLKKL